jgi:hypothetical protein
VTVKDGKRDGRCCRSEVQQAKFVTYPPRISKIANIERKRQRGNWRLSPMRLRPTSKPRNMQLCAVEDRCRSLRDSARTRGPWLSSRAFPASLRLSPALAAASQLAWPVPVSAPPASKPVADREISNGFDACREFFFRSRTKDQLLFLRHSSSPISIKSTIPPTVVCFCCDSPSCLEKGVIFF